MSNQKSDIKVKSEPIGGLTGLLYQAANVSDTAHTASWTNSDGSRGEAVGSSKSEARQKAEQRQY